MTTTTDQIDITAMLAAHALCGQLIEDMPDGIEFASWEIIPGYVGGECLITGWNSAKRVLTVLANQFGLAYIEEPKTSFVQVKATGEIDGVKVSLWAHIGRPWVEQDAAGHSCSNCDGVDPESCAFNGTEPNGGEPR